jgi:hypothetical protein
MAKSLDKSKSSKDSAEIKKLKDVIKTAGGTIATLAFKFGNCIECGEEFGHQKTCYIGKALKQIEDALSNPQ